ncbi:MAG: hypothetical protein IKU83_00180 [Lachnospiraceae bacterium]|nr:hypothetical protein [Lachnospiraceae bacterium]
MRKYRIAVCCLLCVGLLLSSFGCTKDEAPFVPTSVADLWEQIDKTMEALESYKEESVIEAAFYIQDGLYKMNVVSNGISASLDGEPYYYMEQNTEVTYDSSSYQENFKTIRAYYDGTAYLADEVGAEARKLCSKISFQDFEEIILDNSISLSEHVLDCTAQTFEKNSDGNWTLQFSGYTKKTLDEFCSSMGLNEVDITDQIVDLKISVMADGSYRAKSITLEFVFSENVASNTICKLSSTFSAYNETEATPDAIQADQYTKVDDLPVMMQVSEQLEEMMQQESGKSTVTVKQILRSAGAEQTITEVDKVAYGRKNNKLYYEINANYEGVDIDITYQNGKRIISAQGEQETESITEQEAAYTLETLLNCAYYTDSTVADIQKIDENRYRFTMSICNVPGIEEVYVNARGQLTSVTQTITVKFKDGKLVEMESLVEATGTMSNQNVTCTVSSEAKYGESGSASV